MSLARVQFFSISLDGFGTGEGLSLEEPFGHAGERLHEWMFLTRWWRKMVGESGGSSGIDDAFLRLHDQRIGAELMGAGKYGPPGWHEDPEWKGWWGPNPPFHTPVFVLTHHPRESIEMEGGTTFHFVTDGIDSALARAREAAGGQDVKLVGGANAGQQYLAAGLVEEMQLNVAPLLLGGGERLFENVGADLRLEQNRVVHTPEVTHIQYLLSRRLID